MMEPDEFTDNMEEIYDKDKWPEGEDEEQAHIRADDLMCNLLSALGYNGGVSIFKDATRWYS